MEDGTTSEQRAEARVLLQLLDTFEFAFYLHLMKTILGITNELSQALQRKDQDIVNAMNLVRIAKVRLQSMRDNGWLGLLNQVTTFCDKYDIECPNMEDRFAARGRPRRNATYITNEYHYHIGLFNRVLDMLMVEMNERFSEMSSLLLTSVGALYPGNSFRSFQKETVITFAQQYVQTDFTQFELEELDNQLDTYILDVSEHIEFQGLKSINSLSEKMVQTNKHLAYHLVYRVITLALLLPVATASVERSFSAMKLVKHRLRNRMGDEWLNANLITSVEKETSKLVDANAIRERFQNMRVRRGQF
ncbi:unnamed protein product [Calypogeia fissa]